MPAPYTLISLGVWGLVVATAAVVRGRLYATFVAVILGIHSGISVALEPHLPGPAALHMALQLAVAVHFLALVRPGLRPLPYRALVSVPASYWVAGTLLALPWALATALGLEPPAIWLPFAVAAGGLVDSLRTREEVVDVTLDGAPVPGLQRLRPLHGGAERPLRIVQITDPHLGPFMPVERLRRIAQRAVERAPDLVLLTGDFLTMESQGDARHLARALEPLRALPGRVFACRGNHDHEAPAVVAEALSSAGAVLLVDEVARVDTPAGVVELLGFDFHFRERRARMAEVLAAHPRTDGALRVALLHDPGAFRHLPDGAVDLVLSGHTHGGQLGLLWLGLRATIVSALTRLPDHGLWAEGTKRLYVHRGTGHYGFPLRVGVPAEQSLLQVHRAG